MNEIEDVERGAELSFKVFKILEALQHLYYVRLPVTPAVSGCDRAIENSVWSHVRRQ